jgi:signal transduction histidine kinase
MSYVTIIQDEANRLKNQVERVLQMAKLDKEKIKLTIEPHDIHLIIKQAVENLKLTYYPLNCYWLDIGNPNDYNKAQQDFKHIKF